MKNQILHSHSRSDFYRVLQLFFITSSTLIAIRFTFPGILHVPWLFPLIILWAFVLMGMSLYFSQIPEEDQDDHPLPFSTQNQSGREVLDLRSLHREKRWENNDLV